MQLLVMMLCAVAPLAECETLSKDAQVKIVEEIRIPARETGVLEDLQVRQGDLVAMGQVVGKLNTDVLQQQWELAKLDLDLAEQRRDNDIDLRFNRKSQEVAEAALNRAADAIDRIRKSVSATEFDQLRLQAEKAELSVEQAANDRALATIAARIEMQKTRLAQIRLERCSLRSPIDGMVVEMIARKGEWLNPGDPVMRIVRMDRLYVETFVSGQEYGPSLKGKPAFFEVPVPGKESVVFSGSIFFVSPEVHPVTGKIVVIAEIENEQLLLRPGVRGKLLVRSESTAVSTAP